jgi:hypothetical protein
MRLRPLLQFVSKYLRHPQGRSAEENDHEVNDDEHGIARRLRVVPFEAGREGGTHRTSQTRNKEYHPVCMEKLFAALAARAALVLERNALYTTDTSIACLRCTSARPVFDKKHVPSTTHDSDDILRHQVPRLLHQDDASRCNRGSEHILLFARQEVSPDRALCGRHRR